MSGKPMSTQVIPGRRSFAAAAPSVEENSSSASLQFFSVVVVSRLDLSAFSLCSVSVRQLIIPFCDEVFSYSTVLKQRRKGTTKKQLLFTL